MVLHSKTQACVTVAGDIK